MQQNHVENSKHCNDTSSQKKCQLILAQLSSSSFSILFFFYWNLTLSLQRSNKSLEEEQPLSS